MSRRILIALVSLLFLVCAVNAAMTINTTVRESNLATHEMEMIQVYAVADDGRTGTMTFSSDNLPSGATFTKLGNAETFAPYYDGQVGVLRWIPPAGTTGSYGIHLTANNGTHSDTTTVSITVAKNYLLDPAACPSGYTVQGNGDCAEDVYSIYGISKDLMTDPVGGGYGYSGAVTEASADYVAEDVTELIAALSTARNATIYIPADSTINLTGYKNIEVKNNVTIASDRGQGGSVGALMIRYDYIGTDTTFSVTGDGSRVTGLRIIGPDFQRHAAESAYLTDASLSRAFEITVNNFTFDNNELSGWPYVGVRFAYDSEYNIVKYNFIHNNCRSGYGYGILFRVGANGDTWGNIWDWNRHHLATERSTVDYAQPNTSYSVKNSILYGNTVESGLDAHGGNDVSNEAIFAGHNITVWNNTFIPPTDAYDWVAVAGIRGVPSDHVLSYGNWLAYKETTQNTSSNLFQQYLFRLPLTKYINMTQTGNWINLTRPTYTVSPPTSPSSTIVNITYNRLLVRDDANSTWDSLRNGTGTSVSSPASLSYSGYLDTGNSPTTDEYKRMIIYAGYADTGGALPEGSVIDSGNFTVYGADSDASALGVVCAVLADMHPGSSGWTSLSADDYNTSTFTKLSDDCVAGTGTGTYTFTLNAAGIAAVNTTGPTAFALMSNRSVNLDGFNWAATTLWSRTHHRPLDYLNGSYTPSFGLDYHVVDITPPHVNYNFSDTTDNDQSVILWDNPDDTDFNHTFTLWDNVFAGNISNATATITKSGLTELTTYTLATKACDLSDNCNDFANYSITTRADPITTVVNITYNRLLTRDSANSTWYDLRNGSGTAVSSPSTQAYSGYMNTGNTPTDGEYKTSIVYGGYAGATDTFSPGSVIESGTLTVYGAGTDQHYLGQVCSVLVDLHPASTTYTALAASDYQTSTWTKLSDDCVVGAVANQSYTFTLNDAGIAYFNTTGPTAVALMLNRSVNLDGYNWALLASSLSSRIYHRPLDYVSGSFSPSFSIDSYDNGAPANAYAFVEESESTETNITWTNGGTSDFNHTYVMWDNVWAGNLSNTTANFTKSGLTASTSYLFSTKAVDLSGNQNTTWENRTISTASGTIAPYAAFHSNVTTVTAGGHVKFTDDSFNYPTSWYWEFDDGTTSTDQNPEVQFTTSRYLTVNMKATNTAGSDWRNETAYIMIMPASPIISDQKCPTGHICLGPIILWAPAVMVGG